MYHVVSAAVRDFQVRNILNSLYHICAVTTLSIYWQWKCFRIEMVKTQEIWEVFTTWAIKTRLKMKCERELSLEAGCCTSGFDLFQKRELGSGVIAACCLCFSRCLLSAKWWLIVNMNWSIDALLSCWLTVKKKSLIRQVSGVFLSYLHYLTSQSLLSDLVSHLVWRNRYGCSFFCEKKELKNKFCLLKTSRSRW